MKILIKSIQLFLFGVYVELYKKHFDFLLDRCLKNGGDISSRLLTKKSNKSYHLYSKFKEYEKDLKYKILIRSIIKNTV